jgi:hypothetical protein
LTGRPGSTREAGAPFYIQARSFSGRRVNKCTPNDGSGICRGGEGGGRVASEEQNFSMGILDGSRPRHLSLDSKQHLNCKFDVRTPWCQVLGDYEDLEYRRLLIPVDTPLEPE